jgi:hypothetical protein
MPDDVDTSRSVPAPIQSADQGIRVSGPEEIELLIEPYSNGFVWKAHNRNLHAIDQLRLETISLRSFDWKKLAFREAIEFVVRWSPIRGLAAGELTKGIAFIRFEDDHVECGNTRAVGQLSWPSGDPSPNRRWLLTMKVVGLPQEWSVTLDLHWILGTKRFDLVEYSPTGDHASDLASAAAKLDAPPGPRRISAAPPPGTRLSGVAPSPRPIVTTPRITIAYPDDMSEQARRRIFRELIRATDLFDERKNSVRSDSDTAGLTLDVVLHVFGAFSKEASDLARTANWQAERFQSECLQFLLRCARDANLSAGERIPLGIQMTIERSEQWTEFRRQLRSMAEAQAATHPGPPPRQGCKSKGTGGDEAKATKKARAKTVARLIRELNTLKPQMLEDDAEYERLREQYPKHLTFQIAEDRPDLKTKVMAIRGSTRHIRLAQELAAARYGRELSTIQDDWKRHKPQEFRRPK